jgi:hypothetical protein
MDFVTRVKIPEIIWKEKIDSSMSILQLWVMLPYGTLHTPRWDAEGHSNDVCVH